MTEFDGSNDTVHSGCNESEFPGSRTWDQPPGSHLQSFRRTRDEAGYVYRSLCLISLPDTKART
jgi:hypothetical protein